MVGARQTARLGRGTLGAASFLPGIAGAERALADPQKEVRGPSSAPSVRYAQRPALRRRPGGRAAPLLEHSATGAVAAIVEMAVEAELQIVGCSWLRIPTGGWRRRVGVANVAEL